MNTEKPTPKKRAFRVEGVRHEAETIRHNDAFYEITAGEWKGNLIHICQMIDKY